MGKAKRFIALGVLLIMILIGALYYKVDPTSSKYIPQCPVHLLTGLQCPSCGIQRATHAFLHGDIVRGLQYNWYLLYALPFVFLVLLAEIFSLTKLKSVVYSTTSLRIFIAAYLAWFVIRNILGI